MSFRFGDQRKGLFTALAAALLLAGCRAVPKPPATRPALAAGALRLDESEIALTPPPGWVRKPDDVSSISRTAVWTSPPGGTAVGVIRFTLPLPVGHEWALWGFLKTMEQREGRAELIEKQFDASTDRLRFIAEGGRYRIRANLYVRGLRGWAIFAGTLTKRPIDEGALKQAEAARDSAMIEE